MATKSVPLPALPPAPIDRLTQAFNRFVHTASASGVLLLATSVVALVIANSPWAATFRGFWDTRLTVGAGALELSYPLWYWVNDGLMTLFFFVIGLEIKRELIHGELSDRRTLTLPVLAAVGGATVPALLFVVLLGDAPGREGWAVPMATDIAFVVGVLALLGKRVPPGLKVFLLSLAIVDDIIAVLVIAFFYSGALSLAWLGGALAGFAAIVVLQRTGARAVGVYALVGVFIWVCTLKSGIHPTVAGVILGLMTPSVAWLEISKLKEGMARTTDTLAHGDMPTRRAHVDRLLTIARESVSPLARLERALHPWVMFAIMPLFALANAGVALRPEAIGSSLAIAVALGLVVGKTVGISITAYLGVRLGLARLPEGVRWPTIVSGALLSGIGFTMSLFIASLGLEGDLLESAKTGILLGSLVAGVCGYLLLRRFLPAPPQPQAG